jgi:uncharacterized membrane protein
MVGNINIMSFFTKMNNKLNGKVKEQLDDINKIIRKDSKMSDLEQKYGTKKIDAVMASLADIVASILGALKDGLQVTDAFILPTLITKVVGIMENSKEASEELQDLTIEEISYLIGILAQEVLKVFVATKSKS